MTQAYKLIHSVAKILAKVMANRLAPNLDALVSKSQSTFIKGRSIQDNFQYDQGAIGISINVKLQCCLSRYALQSFRQCTLRVPTRSNASTRLLNLGVIWSYSYGPQQHQEVSLMVSWACRSNIEKNLGRETRYHQCYS